MDEAIGLTKNGIAALLGQGPIAASRSTGPRPAPIRAFGLPANLQAELVGRRPDVVAARLTAEAEANGSRPPRRTSIPTSIWWRLDRLSSRWASTC